MKDYHCNRCKGTDYIIWGQRRRCVFCDVESNWHIRFPKKTNMQLVCGQDVDRLLAAEAAWIPPCIDELI